MPGRSLGQEDPLEESMATHSSILAWRIPWQKSLERVRLLKTAEEQGGPPPGLGAVGLAERERPWGREGNTGKALCEALGEVLPSPCQNYALKFMNQDTQNSKEKHIHFNHSCHIWDKQCRRLCCLVAQSCLAVAH